MATVKRGEPRDRYPGLRSFTKHDADLFFGRDRQLSAFTQMVINNRVSVVFGTSGVGKSSLLNTVFEKEKALTKFMPVMIRLTAAHLPATFTPNQSPNVQIIRKNLDSELSTRKDGMPAKGILFNQQQPGLWEYVKLADLKLKSTSPERTLVLVFDQFEEFFYHFHDDQLNFFAQLAEVCHEAPPVRILDWIGKIRDTDRTDQQLDWYTQPDIRIVFSIRADKLSLLNTVSAYVPQILYNRLELKPFTVENARQAIIRPAALSNEDLRYTSPPIQIADIVIERILKDLSNPAGEIEGSFLQIVCYYIETQVKTLLTERLDRDAILPDLRATFLFGQEEYDQEINIDTILDQFYTDQINQLKDPELILLTRKAIEDNLTDAGKRTNLLPSQFEPELDNNSQLIEYLLNARLIRTEATLRGITYELSHDKLIIPVEKAKRIRQEHEAFREQTRQLQLETQQKEHELEVKRAELEKEAELKRLAEEEREKAKKQAQLAEQSKQHAIAAEKIALRAKVRAEQWRRVLLFITCFSFILCAVVGYISALSSMAKNDNLNYQAEDFYNQNNHYFAFKIWQTFLSDAWFGKKDSIRKILNTRTFYDISGGENIRQFNNGRFAVHYKDNSILLWRPSNSLSELYVTELPDTSGSGVRSAENMIVSDNQRYIAYRSATNGEIYVYDDQIHKTISIPGSKLATLSDNPQIHKRNENIQDFKMDFLRDNSFIAYINASGEILIYNLKTHQKLPQLTAVDARHEYFGTDIRNMFFISTDEHTIAIKSPLSETLLLYAVDGVQAKLLKSINHIRQVYQSEGGDSLLYKNDYNDLYYAPFSTRLDTDADLIQSNVVDLLLSPDHSKALILKNSKELSVYDFSTHTINLKIHGKKLLNRLTTISRIVKLPVNKRMAKKIVLAKSIPKLNKIVRWANRSDRFTFKSTSGIVFEIDLTKGQSYFLFDEQNNFGALTTAEGYDYVLSPDGRKCAFIGVDGDLHVVLTTGDTAQKVTGARLNMVKRRSSAYATLYNLDGVIRFDQQSDHLAVITNFDINRNDLNIYNFNTQKFEHPPFEATSIGTIFTDRYIQLINEFGNTDGIMFFNGQRRTFDYYAKLYPAFSNDLKSRFSNDILKYPGTR